VVALVSLTLGMVEYVVLPPAWRRRCWQLVIAVAVLLLALRLGGWLSHLGGLTAFAAYFTFQAGLAGWAARREPGRGHGLVLCALLLYPAAVALAALGYVEVPLLRYFAILPTAVLGMTVLTTGLLRARHDAERELRRRRDAEDALRALNETLERRVAQRTAELSDMVAGLESFNRNVSHDLRGPLGGIATAARLAAEALDAGQPGAVRRYLPAIQAQAQTSAELVTALLALARVGKLDLAPRPLDAAQVVADSVAQLQAGDLPASAWPVSIGPLPTVTADPALLRQVFVNLIGNALKFSSGHAAPSVEVGATVAQGETVLFVRDNGVGFEREDAARLFTPFQRLHGAQFAGAGVGLSIVKRIVERHGGRLWAESTPGAGAAFYFTLRGAPN